MTGRLVVVLGFLTVVVSSVGPYGVAQSTGDETTRQAVRGAARTWLQHVDAGAWSTAWTAAAPGLRDAVAEAQWEERGGRLRKRLGAFRSRRLARIQARDTLRHMAGPGPFFLLRYHSTFAAGLYVETVLLTKDEDAWTVTGYEVAPVAAPATELQKSSREGDGG